MNDMNLFSGLPDHARLWIYATDVSLDANLKQRIEDRLKHFISQWYSHGRKVIGQFAILEDRFIVIAADIPSAEISGCGIDASVHTLEQLGEELGFSLLPGLTVFYRNETGQVEPATRPAFRQLVRDEIITGDSIVFDPSLTQLSQFREGAFELPAHASWHALVFRIPSPIS